MSRFVTGKELEEVVYDILFQAKRQLLLVSPYIKLDTYFREILNRHAHNPELELIVVFGKNEGNITRSVSRADIDYFTKFPSVTLIYAPTLHAKYYGNEVKGVVTSINLYDYSFRHNIEFGVYSENAPLMEKLLETMNKKSLEDQSFEQAMHVASTHDVIFAKRPVYKIRTGLMSKFIGGKDYLEPRVVVDFVEDLLHNRAYNSCRLAGIPKEIEFSQTLSQVRPSRQEVEARTESATPAARKEVTPASARIGLSNAQPERGEPFTPSANRAARNQPSQYQRTSPKVPSQGFCIRTGAPIPFNPDRPFSYSAFKKWAEFGNDEYPERFCHLTGEPSNGRTSKRRPVLNGF